MVSFVLAILMGIFALRQDSKQWLNRIFFLYCMAVAYLALAQFGCSLTTDSGAAAIWLKAGAFWPFIIAFLVHFSIIFNEKSQLHNKLIYFIIYIPALSFAVLDLSTELLQGAPVEGTWGWTYGVPVDTTIYYVPGLWACGMTFAALYICMKNYLGATDRIKKQQTLFVLLGISVPMMIMLVIGVIIPATGIESPNLTSVGFVTGIVFIIFAIYKYRLFQLNTVTAAEEIISTMTDPLLLVNPEGKIVQVNQATLYLLGYERSELIDLAFESLLTEGQKDIVSTRAKQGIAPVRASDIEVIFSSRDSREIPVALSWSPVRDRHGTLLGTVYVGRDLTDRKLAEEELQNAYKDLELRVKERTADLAKANEKLRQEIADRNQAEQALVNQEEYFRALIDNSSDAIIVLGPDMNISYASSSTEQITGRKPEELIGGGGFLNVHPDDMPILEKSIQRLLEGPDNVEHIQLRTQRADGIWRNFEVVAKNLLENPLVKGIVANVQDITKRKLAEDALIESEKRFKEIFSNVADQIVYVNTEGIVVNINKMVYDLVGYTVDEVLGKNIFELNVFDQEQIEEMFRLYTECVTQGSAIVPTMESTLRHKNGSKVYVEMKTSVVTDIDGNLEGFLSIIRDITDRKRTEEEKHQMEQQILLTGRLAAVGELAAGVAHELNNPLAAVQGYAQLLSYRKDLDESIKEDIDMLYQETQRATRITSNLLSFARRHKPEKKQISINEVIEKSLELHDYRLKVNNIEIELDLEENLPETMADFHQLQQVFVNLVTNAEYSMTEAHGKGNLCVRTRSKKNTIQISIIDDGPGIPEENLKRIFDPFFTTKEVGKGTGLGLSICFGIIQEHNGRIQALSTVGEGTTFVIELPIVCEKQPEPICKEIDIVGL